MVTCCATLLCDCGLQLTAVGSWLLSPGNLCHSDESLAQLCGLAQGVSCPNVIVEPVTDGDTATTLRATSLAKDASQAQRDAATGASDDGGGRGSAKTDGAGIASLGAGSVVAPTIAAALGASGSFASAGVFSGVLAAGTFGTDVAAQAAASVGGDAGEGAGGGAGAGAGAGAGMARAGANTPVVMNTTSVAALEDRQARVDDAVQMASKPLAVVTNEGLWRQIEASRRPVRATVVFNVCGEHTVTFRLSEGSPVAHSPFSFMVSPARVRCLHHQLCAVLLWVYCRCLTGLTDPHDTAYRRMPSIASCTPLAMASMLGSYSVHADSTPWPPVTSSDCWCHASISSATAPPQAHT